MKNKVYYILLCLLTSFAFMNTVFAEGSLEFSVDAKVVGGETSVVKGSEVTINIALNSELYISACTFEVTQDSGIERISVNGMNNYNHEVGPTRILIDRSVTDTQFTSGQSVLQLKYKVNNDGKVTIKTLDCTSPTDNKTGSYKDVVVEFDTKEVSDDTTLSNLVVTGGTMSPKFSSSVNQYIIQLEKAEFSLDITASNSDYQDKIVVTDANGNKLDPKKITFNDPSGQASMEITIKVNEKTEYTLLARYEQKELDNSLSSLKVDGKTVLIESGKYDYTVSIGKDVKSVKIEAVLKDSKNFKFADNNGPTIFQTPKSSNTYPLMIEPKDSSIGAKGVTYTITMLKEGTTSDDDKPSTGGENDKPSGDSQGNTTTNPSTGGISMFLMAFILLASLVGSVILYQKNLEGYNK